jgi:Winged helix-turn-helix DNA-binding
MTPTDEATFITLWQQGASQQELAQRLGVPVGTIKSRASALARQGKIQARPKGGAYPHQRHQAAMGPVQTPVQMTAPVQGSVDTGAVQMLGADVEQLKTEVSGLRQLMQAVIDRLDHPPVQTPVQITALPPYPKGKAVRWNLWILDAIRDELATLAAERGVSPSQLVQELLWKELRRE